ncbi:MULTISPECIES: hypothetical protein [unclassified Nocardiopsis]|uniref:hypothetical protein n=1 Tax=Nocardiopsis TaxID=2013 RepID=UPI00387A9911
MLDGRSIALMLFSFSIVPVAIVFLVGLVFMGALWPEPRTRHVEYAEVIGTWEGWEGSRITFHDDGTVEFTDLDGYWFAFDEGWRVTGTGAWEVDRDGRYPKVTVESTEITDAVEVFDDHPLRLPRGDAWRTERPDSRYWVFDLDRKWGELRMYVYMSDPDIREYNWFDRV